MVKLNTSSLNSLNLNSAVISGTGEVQRGTASGGGGIVPLPPSVPEEPEPNPTYTLSASVANGAISATLNGSAISLPYEANEGDVIVVSVEANDGFTFEGWADGVTDNPRTITMASDVVLSAECVAIPSESKYIQFADAEVERVLMSKGVSSDGVGITIEDAERVTSISTWFKENAEITSFNELRHFTKVTELVGNAFYKCTALRSIDTRNIVTAKYGIFQYCTALNQDMVLENVTGTLGENAFRYSTITGLIAPNAVGCNASLCESCPNITKADVRAMTTFGNYAFQRCPNLEEINISSAVTLGKQLFYECTSLKTIDVPSTTTSIGEACFMNCTSLQSVIVRATTPPTLGTRVFNGTTCPIYVPDASLEAYKGATNWSSFASRIKGISEYNG